MERDRYIYLSKKGLHELSAEEFVEMVSTTGYMFQSLIIFAIGYAATEKLENDREKNILRQNFHYYYKHTTLNFEGFNPDAYDKAVEYVLRKNNTPVSHMDPKIAKVAISIYRYNRDQK